MKKVLSILVAAILVLGITVSASAATPPKIGRIYIQYDSESSRNWSGARYFTIYKIFDATVAFDESGKATGAISYTCTDEQKAIPGFDTFFTADASNNVTVTEKAKDSKDPTKLSSGVIAWIKEHISKLGEKLVDGSDQTFQRPYGPWSIPYQGSPEGETGSNWVYYEVPFGYYYIESAVGTVVMIDSANPQQIIKDKNVSPPFSKTITDITNADGDQHNGDIKNDGKAGTVQIGDVVTYTLETTVGRGAENIALLDKPSYGLELVEDITDKITVKADGQDLDPQNYDVYINKSGFPNGTDLLYKDTSYSPGSRYAYYIKFAEDVKFIYAIGNSYINRISGAQLAVVFHQDYLDTITEDTKLTVTCPCRVTPAARVSWEGYAPYGTPNDGWLTFGNAYYKTDYTRVYTARMRVYKYDGTGESSSSAGGSRRLEGVTFVLRNSEGKYYQLDSSTAPSDNGSRGMVYRGTVHWVADVAQATVLATNSQGAIQVDGLTNGTYILSEVNPLPGYNKANDVEFTINNQNNTFRELQKQINVANKTGSVLPETGGIGVTIYYMLGVSLILAGSALYLKKTRSSEA